MATRYRWNEFVLDLDSFRLERAGEVLPLEPKAFNLLALLVSRPGHVFTKQEIFEALWSDTAVTDHALTRVVAQLRRVLADDVRQARFLETVPTRGYRWIHPVETGEAQVVEAPVVAPSSPSPASRTIVPGLSAALVLIVLAVGILAWFQRNTPAQAVDASSPSAVVAGVAWPIQVTTHRGLDFHPAFSPSGDGVAFVSDRSGSLEIYVRGSGGAGVDAPLTTDGGQNVQPAWSPDGRMIAFHSYRRGGVWVVPARGGTPRQIAAVGSRPAWSPDGRQLVFQSDEHTDASPSGFNAQLGSTLILANADGSGAKPLTTTDGPLGGHSSATWSPDGRFVAFTVFEGGPNNGLWLINVESGETKRIHQGRGVYESVFARDGSSLFVAGGEPLITRLPFDAATGTLSGPPQLIPVPGVPGVRGLSISPDGRLGFAGLSLDSQIWKQPLGPAGAPAGDAVGLTTDTSRRNSVPVVSPDGSRVAYVSTRRGEQPNVWMMDMQGREPLQLTVDEGPDHKPQWFQDGTRVAFVTWREGAPAVWAVDVATRRTQSLFELADEAVSGSVPGFLGEWQVAPSLKQVVFSMMTAPSGRKALYVSGTDRFAPRVIGDEDASTGYPAWSPDERFVAVEVKEGESTHAGIVNVASGELRVLTNERGQTWVRSWSPDGRRLAVAALREGQWSLRSIDVVTGRQQVIHETRSPRVFVRYPDWSPRGDAMVFERGEMRANIWTLALGGSR